MFTLCWVMFERKNNVSFLFKRSFCGENYFYRLIIFFQLYYICIVGSVIFNSKIQTCGKKCYASYFSCLIFFMRHIFHASYFSCLIFFMPHIFHAQFVNQINLSAFLSTVCWTRICSCMSTMVCRKNFCFISFNHGFWNNNKSFKVASSFIFTHQIFEFYMNNDWFNYEICFFLGKDRIKNKYLQNAYMYVCM